MTHDDPRLEPHLERLLAAVHAPLDEQLLARARSRIAARGALAELPAWFQWLSTPATLAAAAALCVICGVASVQVLRVSSAGTATAATAIDNTTAVSALLGDDGSDGLAIANVRTNGAGANADSGEGVQ